MRLTGLAALHEAGQLVFFGSMAHPTGCHVFLRHLWPIRKKRWIVYAKAPFAGSEAVTAHLSHYTHRVAIKNSGLLRFDRTGATLRYKNCRHGGADRQQVFS